MTLTSQLTAILDAHGVRAEAKLVEVLRKLCIRERIAVAVPIIKAANNAAKRLNGPENARARAALRDIRELAGKLANTIEIIERVAGSQPQAPKLTECGTQLSQQAGDIECPSCGQRVRVVGSADGVVVREVG